MGKVIKKIEFQGNINTDSSDILSYLEMREGIILTDVLVNNDLKALFATGFFYFIDIQAEKIDDESVKIIFLLKERPRVEEIEFIGAEEVFPSDLRDKMPLKENEVITPEKVNLTREVILKKYRDEGFFHAYVRFEVSKVNPDTNTVKVKFIIDEGDEIPISKINIIGTKHIDASEIMGFLELKESGLIETGAFKEASFETDKQKIVAYMKSKGFLDAEIQEDGTGWEIRWANPKKKDKRVIIVNFKVFEGEIYYYNGYTTQHDYAMTNDGIPIFINKEENKELIEQYRSGSIKLDEFKKELKTIYTVNQLENLYEYTDGDVGEVFDELKLMRDRAMINELYSSKGYLYAQVNMERTMIELNDTELKSYETCSASGMNQENCAELQEKLHIKELREILIESPDYEGRKYVHVDFTIKENHLGYIENIIIKGNKKTLDKVIRRELLFKPGDLFNSALINRSRERVYNLGYFKEVNLSYRPGSDESKINVIIDVQEQPTGTISMGGGYGTVSGFSIFTELGENNLNGTGQRVNGRIEFGPLRKLFQLSWTEPWLNDKPWALTLSMFYSTTTIPVAATSITDTTSQSIIKESASYDRTGLGFSVGVSHRFWINWTHFHIYSPSFFESTNPTSLADDAIRAEVSRGWRFRSEFTNGVAYDNRDNIFNSTRGLNASFSVTNAGQMLGGNSHFNRYTMLAEYYHTWFDYTFFGLIRSNTLRKWKVVQQFRSYNILTYEKPPYYNRPPDDPIFNTREREKRSNPYIQQQDMQFLGGYEYLRGWDFQDSLYPSEWRNGGNHRMVLNTELRFPIEPSLLWLVMFLDAGALFEETNRYVGTRREYADNYDYIAIDRRLQGYLADPIGQYYIENYYQNTFIKRPENPYISEDPSRLVLRSIHDVAIDKFKFSWGVGLRIQIPVLPLRLFFAQRLHYTKNSAKPFEPYKISKNFRFVFGIGDYRF
ncbi:MAG: outer membrane protein assembly factor [Leptospiraceae bacterium]|nr:outer membrane protein assembly factor [Leptospiraceae bacterium]MCP5501393.1 outer membrane protein assembly factor [Leptospiraceae bacterium]